MPGLYAAGECAATRVHGANRMAGNSLTEAVVFGRRAAVAMVQDGLDDPPVVAAEPEDDVITVRTFVDSDLSALREAMTNGASLVRSPGTLREALTIAGSIEEVAAGDLSAAATAARLICASALERDESRGVHFRSDAPEPQASWDGRHVVMRDPRA
jgi:L-aspartate oxidase